MYLAIKAVRKLRAQKKEQAAAAAQAAGQDASGIAPAAGASTVSAAATTTGPATGTTTTTTTGTSKGATRGTTKEPTKTCKHSQQATGTTTIAPDAEKPAFGDVQPPMTTSQNGHLDSKGNCLLCKQEKHNSRVYRWKLIAGLLLPFFLASIDLTIVATALSFIASYFNKYDQLNWIVTSYTLTSTAFIPIFGQLANIFGRHTMLQIAMGLMAVGSTLAAAAQTWGMLLFGRALQGMAAAGIQVLVWVVLADRVSLKEQAKNNSIFSLVSGVSYSIGPVIGGYLTNSNWRYCFVISIPIAVLANVVIFFLLRKELVAGSFSSGNRSFKTFIQSLRSIDIGGAILFFFGVGLIILATAWGGATYPWNSTHVLAPLVIGCVLFIMFFPYEMLLEDGQVLSRRFPHQIAMIPYSLFQRHDIFLLCIVQFATGAALFSIFYFVGIYFTLVEGYSASNAGVQLLYYVPGIGVGVYSAIVFCNVWPGQTFWPIFLGTITETVGFAMITWAVTTRNVALVDGMMGLAGMGTGLRFMPVSLHVCGVWPDKIASVMSLMRFMLPFGGTLSLTIMGSVFNNKMAHVYSSTGIAGQGGFNLHNQHSLTLLKNLPAAERTVVENAGKTAVMWAFVSILPILGISVVAAFFLGNVWVKAPKIVDEHDAELPADKGLDKEGHVYSESKVLHGSYLLALVRGRIVQEQVVSRRLAN